MPLQPSQVAGRSNTDLGHILDIALDLDLTAAQRMALVARVAAGWDTATAGSTGRASAERVGWERVQHGLSTWVSFPPSKAERESILARQRQRLRATFGEPTERL